MKLSLRSTAAFCVLASVSVVGCSSAPLDANESEAERDSGRLASALIPSSAPRGPGHHGGLGQAGNGVPWAPTARGARVEAACSEEQTDTVFDVCFGDTPDAAACQSFKQSSFANRACLGCFTGYESERDWAFVTIFEVPGELRLPTMGSCFKAAGAPEVGDKFNANLECAVEVCRSERRISIPPRAGERDAFLECVTRTREGVCAHHQAGIQEALERALMTEGLLRAMGPCLRAIDHPDHSDALRSVFTLMCGGAPSTEL